MKSQKISTNKIIHRKNDNSPKDRNQTEDKGKKKLISKKDRMQTWTEDEQKSYQSFCKQNIDSAKTVMFICSWPV